MKLSNEDLVVGQNIKKRRKELGLTQDELGKLVGYNGKSMICRVEKGEIDLGNKKMKQIAEALKIDPIYLIGACEYEPSPPNITDIILESLDKDGVDHNLLTDDIIEEICKYGIYLIKNKKG